QSKKRYRADMIIEQHIEKLRKDDKHEEANAIQEKLDSCGSRKSLTEDLYEIIMG
ncbi:MAG TPA: glycine--tRNA ligase, partial [Balneolaceae bacterium]|nr:glycine--tRNA ligase [Balneolaceae bacterium]